MKYKCGSVEYQVGDRFANVKDYGDACIFEIISVAPTLDGDGMQVVFVKEINIPLDLEGNEETTEPRRLSYDSYYDYVVVFGDPIKGNEIYGLEF